MNYKKKGFTLIEVIVTLMILILITSFIFSFFISCYNYFININNNTELQFQAQFILNFMCNKIAVCSNVVDANKGLKKLLNDSEETEATYISFRFGDGLNQCYIFELVNNNIRYDTGRSLQRPTIELGRYVQSIKITPYPEGLTFANAKGIKLKIHLKKGTQDYYAEQLAYMSNS